MTTRTLHTKDKLKLEKKFQKVRNNYMRDLMKVRKKYQGPLADVMLEYKKAIAVGEG